MTMSVRERLQAELAELLDRDARMQAHLRGGASLPQDWDDRNSATQGDEVLEQLEQGTYDRIGVLREAVQRIDQGDYGTCEVCGEAIPDDRLMAMPTARTCVGCAD